MTELVITAKVTDAEGRAAEASVTVDVLEPQPTTTASEGSLA
jgi:hypothetical protein